ncbi:MAG: FG-GAP-like repeat-containing protein, partial [Patescibacteria group bacterium]
SFAGVLNAQGVIPSYSPLGQIVQTATFGVFANNESNPSAWEFNAASSTVEMATSAGCGDGIVQTELGEECDGNTRACTTAEGLAGTQGCYMGSGNPYYSDTQSSCTWLSACTALPTIQFLSSTGYGNESTTPVSITISLSSAHTAAITVAYSVIGGTAGNGGVDYTLGVGTASIPAGSTSANISLSIENDTDIEPDENIIIDLTSPVNARLGEKYRFTYTIKDDDSPSAYCSDSDGGRTYTRLGEVNWYNYDDGAYQQQSDVCRDKPNGVNKRSGAYLIEATCEGSQGVNPTGTGLSTIAYKCPYGCSNGACLPAGSKAIAPPLGIKTPELPVGLNFFAYAKNLRNGMTLSSGNVSGLDGAEIITGTPAGLAPQVQVFNNKGKAITQFFAYDSGLRNGVVTANCDLNGDGYNEIITAQNKGGWPLIKIFTNKGKLYNNGFQALDKKFKGGLNIACGDVYGDGSPEIIVAAQTGGGPSVYVYTPAGKLLATFSTFDKKTFRGGINVAVADFDSDGIDEIVTAPQVGPPTVVVVKIKRNGAVRYAPPFNVFDKNYNGGVGIATGDVNGDGLSELLVTVGPNEQPIVKVYSESFGYLNQFYAYPISFKGGVVLTVGDVDNNGVDEVIVAPRSAGGPQVRSISLLDSDYDGLTDTQEKMMGTDRLNADTDKDGSLDGDEVGLGHNPRKK